jgi:carboxyl-terminal processing protease
MKNKIIFFILCLIMIVSCIHKPEADNNIEFVYNTIKNDYVTPLSDQAISNKAIEGMLKNLDPNSIYLDEKNYEFLKQLSEGHYAGIGIEASSTDNGLKIVSVQEKGPAQRAGLLPNDIIIAANDKSFNNMTPIERINVLRGPANTKVTLKIIRNHANQQMTFTLTRQILETQSVKFKLLPHHIGYIQITFFEKNTANLVKNAVMSLQQKDKLSGIILDLRNNPGGLLESAANVSDLFLDYKNMEDNHLIVSNVNRQGKVMFYANKEDEDILHHLLMVILINHNSASSAEIVAAALHDHHRAILVGTKSYGKGSVQKLIPLKDNAGAIKLTTGYYYTPSGKLIDKIGVYPDKNVSDPNEQLAAADNLLQNSTKKQ